MTTTIPAQYVGYSTAELRSMLQMVTEAVEEGATDPKLLEHKRNLEAVLTIGTAVAAPQVFDDYRVADKLGRMRQPAGQGGAHKATDRQVQFAKRLADEKDTTGVEIPDFDHCGKKAISAFIDRVIDRPNKVAAAVQRPVSEKQINFITKLAGEKELGDALQIVVDTALKNPQQFESKAASKLIDILMGLPRKAVTQTVLLEDGMYLKDGEIFKVYHTVHGANQQVAKRLRTEVIAEAKAADTLDTLSAEDKWEYVGKRGLRGLTAEHRMSLEQAKELGAVYGVCIRCAATLTNEVSIEAAMGPICRGKI